MTLVEIKETLMKKMNDNISEGREWHDKLIENLIKKEPAESTDADRRIRNECFQSACEDIRIMRELKLITYVEADKLMSAAYDRIHGEDVEFVAM